VDKCKDCGTLLKKEYGLRYCPQCHLDVVELLREREELRSELRVVQADISIMKSRGR
jgi:Zn finger protein HypA/HybF involved in hydrogenase expression